MRIIVYQSGVLYYIQALSNRDSSRQRQSLLHAENKRDLDSGILEDTEEESSGEERVDGVKERQWAVFVQ